MREEITKALQGPAGARAPESSAEDRLLSVKEASEAMKVSVSTVFQYRKDGILPATCVRGRALVRMSDIHKALQAPAAPTGHRATPRRGRGPVAPQGERKPGTPNR